jgi:hypothetical protein
VQWSLFLASFLQHHIHGGYSAKLPVSPIQSFQISCLYLTQSFRCCRILCSRIERLASRGKLDTRCERQLDVSKEDHLPDRLFSPQQRRTSADGGGVYCHFRKILGCTKNPRQPRGPMGEVLPCLGPREVSERVYFKSKLYNLLGENIS